MFFDKTNSSKLIHGEETLDIQFIKNTPKLFCTVSIEWISHFLMKEVLLRSFVLVV
jgi:hypothetical protein